MKHFKPKCRWLLQEHTCHQEERESREGDGGRLRETERGRLSLRSHLYLILGCSSAQSGWLLGRTGARR